MNHFEQFPHITDYANKLFAQEKKRLDYLLLRPIFLVLYFLVRCILFPIKFLIHRKPWGFEHYLIDAILAFGIKYIASKDAVELLIRHVQIEPMLYRHILLGQENEALPVKELQGIDGIFNVDSLNQIIKNNMTIGHDELSYELADRFDKHIFLDNLDEIRLQKPLNIEQFSRKALDINKKHSLGLIGATNVVLMIVYTITIFSDLRTAMKALNSFGSDSILLWALKHIYQNNPNELTDLDFYMQVYSNRSHYDNSAFFSDPSQYLYYHIAFDEFAYELLHTRPPSTSSIYSTS